MALFSRSLLARSNQAFASILARSFSSSSLSGSAVRSLSLSTLLLHRLRPLAAASTELRLRLAASTGPRGFATRSTTSSLSDPNPNWSNRPPKETILLDGCDFEHWLVVMEKPEGDPTRDEIIDSYIKTLAAVVGSEDDARMKIYSVSTRYYFAFGALVPEEVSFKLKELPRVRWVLPDSYLDVRNKDYGGEPFLNGQAVPYDSKFHEEWVRNNARANERNRRSDRPRNFDRSRSFERRRENVNNNQSSYQAGPTPNNQGAMPPEQGFQTGPPPNNMAGPPPNRNYPLPNQSYLGGNVPPPNQNGPLPNNQGAMPPDQGFQSGPPPNNMAVPPPNRNYPPPNQSYLGGNVPPPNQNYHQGQNMQYNQGGSPPPYNRGGAPPYNNGGTPPQYNQGGAPPQYNQGGVPPQYNQGGVPPQYNNMGGVPPQYNNMGGVPPQYNNMGGMLPQNNTGGVPTQNMNQGPSSENYTPSRDPAAVPNGEL